MEEIRYLLQKEKYRTRDLYERAFSEDSAEFVDYYYQWKTRDNQILVMEEEGRIQVMLHLNPYSLLIWGHGQEVPYIVAVATEPDCQRQGKMRRVMEFALQDLERRGIPFAFLLPADPAYYQGQGFVFFPENSGKKTGGNQRHSRLQWSKARPEDIPELAEFSNHILKEQYHIFIRREETYYKRLFAELETEQGGILLGRMAGALEGALTYGMERPDWAEVKELLLRPGVWDGRADCAEEICTNRRDALKERRGGRADSITETCRIALPGLKINTARFDMMFRIASLKDFVSLMKSEAERCYEIEVKDSVIGSNCGCYRIEIGKDGGRMQRISREQVKQELDISSLARLLVRDIRVHLGEWV